MNLDILISTIVTSTAALIAIIGGFLVSRVITLASEQSGITRKIREINSDITAKENTLLQINNYIVSDDAIDFIRYNADALSEDELSLKKIHKASSTELAIEQLAPYVDKYKDILREVKTMTGSISPMPHDFYEMMEQLDYDLKYPNQQDFYEIAYNYIYKSRPVPTSRFSFVVDTTAMSNIPIIDNKYYHEQVKIKEKLEAELMILKLQKKEQEKIISEHSNPNGVWGGLGVLMYCGTVGIAYPVTLLPYSLNTYNDGLTKIFLIITFISELVVIFGYLIFALQRLMQKKWSD